jgi:VanZ family protein
VLTLIPGEDLPDVDFFQIDKVVHFFIFGVLMILSSYALKKTADIKGAPTNPLLRAALFSIGFGITIEFLQLFVPGRSFSVLDMLANSIGVGLGYLIFMLLKKRNLV